MGALNVIIWILAIILVLSIFTHGLDSVKVDPVGTAKQTVKETMSRFTSNTNATPSNSTSLGRPPCNEDLDCIFFGENVTCDVFTGECYNG